MHQPGDQGVTALAARAFVDKWSRAELTERAASHEHFLDLCRLLNVPTPASADATGDDYCFEKHVKVVRSASKGSRATAGSSTSRLVVRCYMMR
jgi:hypothetical protein